MIHRYVRKHGQERLRPPLRPNLGPASCAARHNDSLSGILRPFFGPRSHLERRINARNLSIVKDRSILDESAFFLFFFFLFNQGVENADISRYRATDALFSSAGSPREVSLLPITREKVRVA
jgi:hypothetical protein